VRRAPFTGVYFTGNAPSVRPDRFGFNLFWADGKAVVMEASTNLPNPGWLPLQTNTLRGGSFYFTNPQWTNHPTRSTASARRNGTLPLIHGWGASATTSTVCSLDILASSEGVPLRKPRRSSRR
jgi:hypothetical protein